MKGNGASLLDYALYTIIILILGFINIFSFFYFYDFNITPYLTASELPLTVAPILTGIIPYFLLVFTFMVLSQKISTKAKDYIRKNKKKLTTVTIITILIGVIYIFTSYYLMGYFDIWNRRVIKIEFTIIFICLINYFLFNSLRNDFLRFGYFTLLLLLFYIGLINYLYYINIKNKNIPKQNFYGILKNELKNDTIKSDDAFRYIGATSNYYIFKTFYTKDTNSVFIYNKADFILTHFETINP